MQYGNIFYEKISYFEPLMKLLYVLVLQRQRELLELVLQNLFNDFSKLDSHECSRSSTRTPDDARVTVVGGRFIFIGLCVYFVIVNKQRFSKTMSKIYVIYYIYAKFGL